MNNKLLTKNLTDRAIARRTRYEDDWESIKEYLQRLSDYQGLENDQFEYAIQEAKNYFNELILNSKGIVLCRDAWYSAKIGNQIFWRTYHNIMIESNYSKERIEIIEKQSQDIINFLPCPAKERTEDGKNLFCKKGLVYGNVQSGKTAAIAGIISMYASANCKFIFILSGITNNLRMQTQKRVIHDLGIDRNATWHLLTGDSDRVSKGERPAEALDLAELICIGVFKKNPSALKRLILYCNRTKPDFWKNRQVLIIDDECDQYSPNVSDFCQDDETGEEYTHSKINGLIIELCSIFPRNVYIGFTATPFANVLNEMPGTQSLYPTDFIYALEKPDNYFGGDKIFGKYDEETENDITLNITENISLDDIALFKTPLITTIPESLKNSILYFIAATACKYQRNIAGPSTMLIHLDVKTAVHATIEIGSNNFIASVRKEKRIFNDLIKTVWENQRHKVTFREIQKLFKYDESKETLYSNYPFSILENKIQEVIDKIEVIVDNSTRPVEERLDYEIDKDQNKVFIVIGGNTLSRGITLEGLIVSYFARDSRTYDTLLQMGRWYGYRPGYEDISRIWIPNGKFTDFQFLSNIEQEIRDEIDQYDFDLTPEEIGMRIRTHPKLQITRKLAMQSAVSTLINCSGQKPQTLFFKRKNKNWLDHNLESTRSLLNSITKYPTFVNNAWLYKNISATNIIEYISSTFFHERNRDLKQDILLKYINKANSRGLLLNWNIAVLNAKGNETLELSKNLTVELIERSRIDEENNSEDAYIKILQQPKDMLLDMDSWKDISSNLSVQEKFKLRNSYFKAKGELIPGLLVLYPIKKDSKPLNSKNVKRRPLDAIEHVIGQMFVFPLIRDKELYEYMRLPI